LNAKNRSKNTKESEYPKNQREPQRARAHAREDVAMSRFDRALLYAILAVCFLVGLVLGVAVFLQVAGLI
jgi:cell division septal protein FtsQ